MATRDRLLLADLAKARSRIEALEAALWKIAKLDPQHSGSNGPYIQDTVRVALLGVGEQTQT